MKISGRKVGKTIVSLRIFLTSSNPLISFQVTFGEWSSMVSSIDLTISGSRPLGCFSIIGALGASGIIGGIIYSSAG